MSKARDLAGIFNLGPRSGTTAQRPSTAEVGDIFYNGTTGKTEIYTTTGWKEMASGIPFGNTASRPTGVTGQPYFNGEVGRLEMYTSAGWQNIVQEVPGVSSITGTYLESANSGTISITGTNFAQGSFASAIGTNGVEVIASSTTFNSLVQITAVFTGLSNAYEPYDIKVTNPSNLFGLIPDALYINASPVWQTASGSLGTFMEQVSVSVSATATDESTITYALASGSTLPTGLTLNSSNGIISGTLPDIATTTTYNFTINASDGSNSVVPRAFSILSNVNQPPVWNTASGSLGSFSELSSISIQLSATDPEAVTLSYSVLSGTLPSGVTLSSAGLISGTLPNITTSTTYSFTIRVSDGINNVDREFTIASNAFAEISGGTLISSDATYYYRVFPTVGTTNLVTSGGNASIEYLLIGGGGGGGNNYGGGGGGVGGILYGSTSLSANTYPIVVGSGGGSTVSGSSTTAFGFTAGGGAFGVSNSGAGGNAGSPLTYVGGAGASASWGESGGGGAGAAANGGNGSASSQAGAGGLGSNSYSAWLSAISSTMPSAWQTATSSGRIGGGGGGGGARDTNSNVGGSGGGGNGGAYNSSGDVPGVAGVTSTGSGGGGSRGGSTGGAGGSGLAVIRYAKSVVGG